MAHLLGIAIKPKSKKDSWKLRRALSALAKKDSTLAVSSNWFTGQSKLKGMSEDQLESIINRVKNEYKIDIDVFGLEIFSEIQVVNGKPRVNEPIMRVKVVTPEEYMGSVIGDFNLRRGHVSATEDHGGAKLITGLVPLEEMFGYTNKLNSMTRWQATYTMELDHYQEVVLPEDHPPKRPAMIMRG